MNGSLSNNGHHSTNLEDLCQNNDRVLNGLSHDELRELSENLNFNLTSVLANPRQPPPSLFDLPSSIEAFFSTEESEPDYGKSQTISGMEDIATLERMRAGYLSRTIGPDYKRFCRNHPKISDQHHPGTLEGGGRASEMELSPQQVYDEVPLLFQKTNFSLAEPIIFEKVVSDSPPERQEQLTQYLDLVEVCLLRQISSRQDSFFEALSNLQDLQLDVTQACTKVNTLRRGVRGMQQNMVSGTMKVPQLARRKSNLNALHSVLEQVLKVLEAKDAVEALFKAEDFAGALSILTEARKMTSESLHNVRCVHVLDKQLMEYELSAIRFLATQFVNVAVDTNQTSLVNDNSSNNSKSNAPAAAAAAAAAGSVVDAETTASSTTNGGVGVADNNDVIQHSSDQKAVANLMTSLIANGEMSTALEKHRIRLGESIKLIVRIAVQEYVYSEDDGNPDRFEVRLGPRICALSPQPFLSCLEMCFESMLESLYRAQAVHFILEQELTRYYTTTITTTTRTTTDLPPPPSGGGGGVGNPSAELVNVSLKTLRDTCELAQKSVGNLLVMRKDVHTTLTIEELKEMWNVTFEFLTAMERISGRSCYALRSTMLAQAKAFLEHKQEVQMASLVATLDSEKWTQADVSPQRQQAIDRLSSGQAFLPGTLVTPTNKPNDHNNNTNNTNDNPVAATAAAGEVKRPSETEGRAVTTGRTDRGGRSRRELNDASVDGSSFKVVWSVLLLIEMVTAHLAIAAHFPMLATDVLQRVVELVRLFNTRATQLVLLAGAIHSTARLTKITAKHLALTCQCLGLVMALIPHVRASLSAQLPPKHHLLLSDMDRVKQDLMEHHGRIISKFVSIVAEIVDSLAPSIASTDWETGGNGNCQFITDSIKNMFTMHKVLSAQLPPEQLQEIFSRIFELLNQKVPEYFASVTPSSLAGEQRVVDDIQYLTTSLDRLKGVSAANLNLDDHFRARFPNAR